MRRSILGLASLLALPLSGQVAQANCTAGPDNPNNNPPTVCYRCSLSWFNSKLECYGAVQRADGTYQFPVNVGSPARTHPMTKTIDDCVGNLNGQFVRGLGAGDSCINYSIDADLNTLNGVCRDGTGRYQPTFIRLNYAFEWKAEEGVVGGYLGCAGN